jgi:cell division protein FtsB
MKGYASRAASNALRFMTPLRLVVLAALAALFWIFIMGDQGAYQFRRLLEMRNRLLSERARLNADIDRLSRERDRLSDPENLEMVIRSELGYIKPGDVLFEEKKKD